MAYKQYPLAASKNCDHSRLPRSSSFDTPASWTRPKGAWDTHFHVLEATVAFSLCRRTAGTRRRMPHSMHACACMTCWASNDFRRRMPTRTDLTIRSTRTPLPSQQAVTGRGATRCQRHPAACRSVISGGRAWRSLRIQSAAWRQVDLKVDHVMRCIDALGWFVELTLLARRCPTCGMGRQHPSAGGD